MEFPGLKSTLILAVCTMALPALASVPAQAPEIQQLFDTPRFRVRERAYLEDFIKRINHSGRAWLKRQGRVYNRIPQQRVEELAGILMFQAKRDYLFFYEIWLPIVATESVFVNAVNDLHLPPHRRSVGYAGVNVATAGKPAGWLIREWRWALEFGYDYARNLNTWIDDPLHVMSAYRTGPYGYRKGRRAITDWMRTCHAESRLLYWDLVGLEGL